MKRILFALTVMAATLVSCSKDNGGGNGDGSEKLVSEIAWRSGDYLCVRTYEYDSQNRITRMVYKFGEELSSDEVVYEEVVYEYGEDSILELWGHREEGIWMEDYRYKYYLDDTGYVVRQEEVEYNEVFESFNFEYENGQLKKVSNDEGLEVLVYWSNGDIVGLEYDGWKYTNIENKTNLNMMALLGDYVIFSSSWIKFKGMSSKHLPEESFIPNYHSYSYELDSEGYPTKIKDGIVEYHIKYY